MKEYVVQVQFSSIAQAIMTACPKSRVWQATDTGVYRMKFLGGSDSEPEAGVLYVVPPEHAAALADLPGLPENLMLLGGMFDSVDQHERAEAGEINLILLDSAPDFPPALNAISELFQTQNELMAKCNSIWNAISRDMSIRRVLEVGCDLLKAPLQVFNSGFSLIDYLEHQDVNDQHYSELNKLGKMPSDVMKNYIKSGYIRSLHTMDDMQIFEHPGRKHRSVWTKIHDNERTFGFLVTLERSSGSITWVEREILLNLARALVICMKHSADVQELNDMRFEQLMDRVLRDKTPVDGSISQELLQYGGISWGAMQVLVICADRESTINTPYNYVLAELKELFPEGRGLVFRDSIVLVMNVGEKELTVKTLRRIEGVLQASDMVCGISNVFSDIGRVREHFLQGNLVIQVGKKVAKDKKTHFFGDYTAYYPLHAFDAANNLLDLCHPLALCLLQYDEDHNTSLTITMDEYLKSRCSAQGASRKLHIHRNSLYYRLNTIKDVIGTDLNGLDDTTFFDLLNSIHILKYCGKIDAAL